MIQNRGIALTARWAVVYGARAVLVLAAALLASTARAGAPDPSCTAGCPGLLSNQIAFLYDDPNGYEIVAELDFCGGCNTLAPGVFQLIGQTHVDFGPYTVAGCDPDEATVIFPIDVVSVFVEASPPPTGEMKYVPGDPAQVFPRAAGASLRTACVAAGNLDYSIPNIGLIGNLGAATPGFDPVILTLPKNVRGVEDDGSPAATNDLPPFSFRQDLTFEFTDSKNDVSPFRFWPDGLPFRLGPGQITYTEHDVSFTMPGGTEGPTPYEAVPPHAGGVLDDDNSSTGGVINCDESDGVACTASYVYSGGYFEAAWSPAGAFFDANGLDVDLSLPGTGSVTYEPVFPRGVKVTLEGPGSIPIRASAIAPGGFGGGTVRLTYDAAVFNDATNDCPPSTVEHVLDLNGASLAPEVGAGGVLLAGIEDLNASALFFLWSHNGAQDLGCGTLYVPPVLSARGSGPGRPQEDWLASARPTERGRGVYAGVNYNRNGICTSGGVPTGEACVDDGDCAVGICETYSPRCELFDPNSTAPTWRTHVEGSNLVFDIAPSVSTGKEMAFFARASGVTGVFDGGQTPLAIGDPNIPTFDLEFNRFGLAFKNSLNHPDKDSIVRGQVNLPWPSRTDIPFAGLTVCDCGSLASAQVPEIVQERSRSGSSPTGMPPFAPTGWTSPRPGKARAAWRSWATSAPHASPEILTARSRAASASPPRRRYLISRLIPTRCST
jgi:hypothetical protein